jgi:hypothetical protein
VIALRRIRGVEPHHHHPQAASRRRGQRRLQPHDGPSRSATFSTVPLAGTISRSGSCRKIAMVRPFAGDREIGTDDGEIDLARFKRLDRLHLYA